GEPSYATGINSAGQIVGYADRVPGASLISLHAFRMQNGVMSDLGSLVPGGDSYAYAINPLGDVVGRAANVPGAIGHAFRWTSATGMVDLGTLGGDYSEANAINSAGLIVGDSMDAQHIAYATLWQNGQIYDLNTLVTNLPAGWRMEIAYDINESGCIA